MIRVIAYEPVTAQRSLIKWDSQDCRRGNRKSCYRAICSNGFIRTDGSHCSCSLALYTLSCSEYNCLVNSQSKFHSGKIEGVSLGKAVGISTG